MGLISWLQLSLVCTISTLLVQAAVAQNPSPQDYLDRHNAARAEVGVGPMSWDNTVATYAQDYANQRAGDCSMVHSGGSYGENIAWSSGSSLSGADAVNMWVDEKKNYDHNSNSCNGLCGHYTQVVWRDSVRLGCGSVSCNNGGGTFVVCSYDPAGNVVGQSPY